MKRYKGGGGYTIVATIQCVFAALHRKKLHIAPTHYIQRHTHSVIVPGLHNPTSDTDRVLHYAAGGGASRRAWLAAVNVHVVLKFLPLTPGALEQAGLNKKKWFQQKSKRST